MLNKPLHDAQSLRPDSGPALDHAPQLRIVLLLTAFLLPVAVISARLGYLQIGIPEQFVSGWDRQTEEYETLPCRDGRILTADGMIVAYDEPRFDLLVHYRWLEDPPNESWIVQQARSRLAPSERRDPERLAAAREEVLARRDAMLASLAAATGLDPGDLETRRERIQRRVERIHAYVSRLSGQRRAESAVVERTTDASPWEQAWDSFVSELTSAPERTNRDPLVIKEQELYHALVENVSMEAVGAVEALPSQYPGVQVGFSTQRVYPAGDFAAHIVGVRTSITPDELHTRKQAYPHGDPLGYQDQDRIGRSGLERAYDTSLHGRAGLRRIVKDRHGVIVHSEVVRAPIEGEDLVLSFDSHLQSRVERLLDEALQPAGGAVENGEAIDAPPAAAVPQGGCIVALDVHSGRVLAAAAAPRFDLNLLVNPDVAEWEAVNADPRQPFFPRITQMTVPPGSVFKILTSVALLESGAVDPDAPFHCRGYLDRPDRDRCFIYRHYGVGHGDVDLESALCHSCNVYFFDAARRIGPEAIHGWAARFGLGEPSGCDVPGERGGQLPSAEDGETPWYPGTTLQFAIGQASLTVTPLQIARMMAAVANDGRLVTPHFVRDTAGGGSEQSGSSVQLVSYEFEHSQWPASRIEGLSADTLWRVRAGLKRVVEDPRGTGKHVRLEQISIAGKTGTAEVGGGHPDHAWFAGYAPADQPRVAFVVVLEHGGSGGQVAGPVARQLVEAMLETGALQPGPRE